MILNRSNYFDYIEGRLNELAYSINSRGRLNILNYHNHSENFYAYLLNELYSWELGNANKTQQNVEAIDLIDHDKKIVVQVSATTTVSKIESSLKKKLIKDHSTYTFKFVSIAKDIDELRKKSYINPHSIKFAPLTDIIDQKSILDSIINLEIDPQRRIYDLIRKELGNEIDTIKIDSYLASIINILSKETWDGTGKKDSYNPFEINRKIVHNSLKTTKRIIDEYGIYHNKVDEKYAEFDSSGSNKSYSVLQLIGRFYITESNTGHDSDTIFLTVCQKVREVVESSGNFVPVDLEVMVLCIDILVVDAFIRCKIFENPENYNHAFTR
jgi:hypothetical protein